MKTFVLQRTQSLPRSIEDVFAFFADATNLEAITPTWLGFRILTPPPIVMQAGTRIVYRLRWHGCPLRWVTEITRWQPPHEFVDVQRRGPYRLWQHTHRFQAVEGGTLMQDEVCYALPFGWLGRLAQPWPVAADLEAIFAYRAARVAERLSG